jgi:hypothetical protein
MNLILHWTNHHAVEMMMNLLRCIVVMELCQNAWSFSVVSQNSQGRDEGGTLLQKARRGQIAIPWRKTNDKKDEAHVWLEDEFLDEKGDDAPDINYSVEVGRYEYEGDITTVDPVSGVLTEGFDHGVLDDIADEELAP